MKKITIPILATWAMMFSPTMATATTINRPTVFFYDQYRTEILKDTLPNGEISSDGKCFTAGNKTYGCSGYCTNANVNITPTGSYFVAGEDAGKESGYTAYVCGSNGKWNKMTYSSGTKDITNLDTIGIHILCDRKSGLKKLTRAMLSKIEAKRSGITDWVSRAPMAALYASDGVINYPDITGCNWDKGTASLDSCLAGTYLYGNSCMVCTGTAPVGGKYNRYDGHAYTECKVICNPGLSYTGGVCQSGCGDCEEGRYQLSDFTDGKYCGCYECPENGLCIHYQIFCNLYSYADFSFDGTAGWRPRCEPCPGGGVVNVSPDYDSKGNACSINSRLDVWRGTEQTDCLYVNDDSTELKNCISYGGDDATGTYEFVDSTGKTTGCSYTK